MVLAPRSSALEASSSKAHRHARAAAKLPRQTPGTSEYLVVDPDHRPDLRGELAGQKVYYRAGRQYVRLTEAQARFYLDQGTIEAT